MRLVEKKKIQFVVNDRQKLGQTSKRGPFVIVKYGKKSVSIRQVCNP